MKTTRSDAMKAATEFIDRCIATQKEYGGDDPPPDARALAIRDVAKITARRMDLAEKLEAQKAAR
jgi:hypothetical protein